MRWPSVVTAGWSTTSSIWRWSSWRRASRLRASAISSVEGSRSTVPCVPSTTSIVPASMRSTAEGKPITAGIPIEWARIAACDVLVPSSLTSAMTCSRSNCTVRPGPISRATRIDGRLMRSRSASPRCIRWLIMRIARPFRSARRSLSRVLRLADHRSRTSSTLNSNAFSAVRWFSRIRFAIPVRNSLSSSISIWASKMRAWSGPARSSARARNSAMWRFTSRTAARNRRTSFSTCMRDTTRCGTSGNPERTITAGPMAIPGETPMPFSRRSLIRLPPRPRPPRNRSGAFRGTHRRPAPAGPPCTLRRPRRPS